MQMNRNHSYTIITMGSMACLLYMEVVVIDDLVAPHGSSHGEILDTEVWVRLLMAFDGKAALSEGVSG
jgi:hypothetical protein